MAHDFLSDDWFDAVLALQTEYSDEVNKPAIPVKMNQVITEAPVGDGTIELHMDTGADEPYGQGHMEEADVTVTADYETARAILVDQDQQAAMQAFMSGKIKVQGDMAKLMAMQGHQPNDKGKELADKIKELTT